MIRMDEIQKMKKAFREGSKINELAKRFNRSWKTVKRIIETSVEELRNQGKRPKRKGSVTTPEVIKAIDGYLDEEIEKGVWKKQRYTAKVIFNELKTKGIYLGSKRQMQDVVKKRRIDRAQLKPKTYLPLEFPIGTSAQFDHGEVDCIIEGYRKKFYLFICSVPNTGLRYCQIFPTKSQEAWGEFHERAYQFFGGIFPVAVYDNDSVLVKEVLGSQRKQTDFSLAMEEHYKVSSHFCNLAAGNEKGAVENGVGYCRRNYLAGLPNFGNWPEINKYLEKSCRREINDSVHYRTGQPLNEIFAEVIAKTEALLPPYYWRRTLLNELVNHCQMVQVNSHGYSVPEKYVGSRLKVEVRVFTIEIYDQSEKIASHNRKFKAGEDSLKLDHYLDQLERKPGALWDCKPIKQHDFEPEFMIIWEHLKERYSEKNKANRQFIAVIQLHRKYGLAKLIEALQKAIELGVSEPDAIESILRGLSVESPNQSEVPFKNLPNIEIPTWNFDSQKYGVLVEGVTND